MKENSNGTDINVGTIEEDIKILIDQSSENFFLTSAILPHENAPSEHFPFKQEGPAFEKRSGATLRHNRSISVATSRISH